MVVDIRRRVLGQIHRRHDFSHGALVPENAPVCKQRESQGLGVLNHPAPRRFLILFFPGSAAILLEQRPNFRMLRGWIR